MNGEGGEERRGETVSREEGAWSERERKEHGVRERKRSFFGKTNSFGEMNNKK
jgi:hypothetical protein